MLEVEWYQRTEIFPIHGLIVIKNAVLAEHPWVAAALLRAFQASKELYLQHLADAGPSTADDRLILENQELIGVVTPLWPRSKSPDPRGADPVRLQSEDHPHTGSA